MPGALTKFYQTVTEAVDDLVEHGYDSQLRLEQWLAKLRATARGAIPSDSSLQASLKSALTQTFNRATTRQALLKVHSGVSEYTLANIKPKLRAELDRRILASANLIKLNSGAIIERTLQRFAGWASSVPRGGTNMDDRATTRDVVRRGIAGLPTDVRHVVIDQSYKLTAAINDIVANDGGAIAAVWRHVHERHYDARPEHVERDGEVYLIRDSWAHARGFIKTGGGFTDEIEQPAELPYCRCRWEFLYTLRDLPKEMLTVRGRDELSRVRAIIRSA